MSSDTFRYRIDRVDGRDVLMTIRPTTAGGLADLAWSRSFVLMILERRGLPVDFEHTMDAAWLAAHLDEYVTRVEIVRLAGIRYEQILRRQAEQWHIPAQHLQPSLTLRVTLASEALAAYLTAPSRRSLSRAIDHSPKSSCRCSTRITSAKLPAPGSP